MKNSDYIKENKLEKQFKKYIDEKCDEAYNRLKKETKINMKPALTKNEKILLANSTNLTLTLEAIREGRVMQKELGENAEAEQRKKIKKMLAKLDKEREEHLKEASLVTKIREVKYAKKKEKNKGFFSKLFGKKEEENPLEMTYDEALQLEEEYLKKHKGKDLKDALYTRLYGKDYANKQHNIENEVFSISNEDKDKEYAILYYLNGEALEYAKNVLEANFIKDHKTYND